MKKFFIIFFISTLTVLSVNATKPDYPYNYSSWKAQSESFQLGYLRGLFRGYGDCYICFHGLLESYPNDSSLSDLQEIIWQYGTFLDLAIDVTSGMTLGQMVDGIDEFYKDYRNRLISVENILRMVKMQIDGKSQAEIDSLARSLRSKVEKE